MEPKEKKEISDEMDQVIGELQRYGVQHNTTEEEVVGLGDVVESVLNHFGVTQERFKEWFNLKSCRCDERKKYLNNLFSWHKRKG